MMVHKIEILESPDEKGRVVHFRFWWDNYFPGHPEGERTKRERGQIFKTPVPLLDPTCQIIDSRKGSGPAINTFVHFIEI